MRWLITALLALSTCHPLFFLAAVMVAAIWANGQKESACQSSSSDKREVGKISKPCLPSVYPINNKKSRRA